MKPASARARLPAATTAERVGRPSIDSLLLAAFAASSRRRVRRLADLGAGRGEVALAVQRRVTCSAVELVEADPELCERAMQALRARGVPARVHCLTVGRDGLPETLPGACDLIACNPPYRDPARGRRPGMRRAAARAGRLEPFLDAAALLLERRGRACFSYPADELARLFALALERGLSPKRLRMVHATEASPARIALVAFARARPGGLTVEPPCIEWAGPQQRTDEIIELSSEGERVRSRARSLV